MPIQFFNKRMAKTRIAELCAEIETNGGTPPTNCGELKTSKESRAEIDKLESIVADCRARKASAKAGTPMPLIACLADKTAVREAITARLEASKASVAASAAKLKAQAAVAAVATAPKPTAPATDESVLDQFNGLQGAEATAYYREHGRAIRAALAARNDDKRRIEGEMKQARASARQLRELNKRNR
jgi:hypothetical protein